MSLSETAILIASRPSLLINTSKDLTPKELGRLLIITENLYRIALIFEITTREYDESYNAYNYDIRRKIKEAYDFQFGVNFEAKKFLHNLELRFFDLSDIGHIYYATNQLPSDFLLAIGSINYNSPGKIDLLGIGEVVRHLKDFFFDILKIRDEAKRRKLEIRKQEEELMSKRLENVNKFLEISKEHNLDYATTTKIIREIGSYESELYDFAINGKLDSVSVKENDT